MRISIKRIVGPVSIAALLIGLTAVSGGQAGDASFTGAGGMFNVPVTSLKERQFHEVIQQQYDFSCGSAAVATLLTYHYGRPTSEAEVFEAMYASGDQAKIQRLGFSLLDMKEYLATLDLKADGFEVPLEKLAAVGVPAITLIETEGYKHFVLVKGISPDLILVGDSALGIKVYARQDFEEIWNGILFGIRNDGEYARRQFNKQRDWDSQPGSPVQAAVDRDSLATFSLQLGRNQF